MCNTHKIGQQCVERMDGSCETNRRLCLRHAGNMAKIQNLFANTTVQIWIVSGCGSAMEPAVTVPDRRQIDIHPGPGPRANNLLSTVLRGAIKKCSTSTVVQYSATLICICPWSDQIYASLFHNKQ
jgi:hypothetical protein